MSDTLAAPLPGQSDRVVQVESLSKKYGDNVAVNGISFNLTKGEVFAFLGPNGAGKTTTVEILECLRNPTGGRALVLGYDVSKRSDQAEIRKRIGVLPQDFNAIDRLTVRENIDYFGAMFKQQLDAAKLIEHGQIIATGTPDQLIDTHGGKKTLIIRDAGQEGISQLPPGLPKAELRNAGDIAIPLNNGELTSILMSLAQTPLHDKEIEVRRPTLDDVFLNLTGRRVSEEGN